MDETEITKYIIDTFEGVETENNYGYTFFMYKSDHRLPFATLIAADTEYDRISNLDRPGVYRLNIGVGRQAFQKLFGPNKVDTSTYDFTALNTLMPHPEYSAQFFVCVLNPSGETLDKVKALLAEAYEVAERRNTRRQN